MGKVEASPKAETADALLSVDEVAAQLKVKPDTIYKWTCQRRIRFHKVFGSIRFKQSDINQLIAEGEITPFDPSRKRPRGVKAAEVSRVKASA